jgi:hypothetical protein
MKTRNTLLVGFVTLVIFVMLSAVQPIGLSAAAQEKAAAATATTGVVEPAADKPASVARYINVNPYGVLLEQGTFAKGFGPNAGIRLPNSQTPDISFGFTVPPDYVPGTSIIVRIVWHSPSTSCGIELRPNYISVARAGRTHIIGSGVTSGLAAIGGTVLNASGTANRSDAKDYLITSPDGATDIRPGDSVIVGLFRSADASTDTCGGDLVIQAISVIY